MGNHKQLNANSTVHIVVLILGDENGLSFQTAG